jgi:hypothetical protein
VSSTLLPYAAITAVDLSDHVGSKTPSTHADPLAPTAYRGWFESIMMDSWLRDGRTDLVDALRAEAMTPGEGASNDTTQAVVDSPVSHEAHEFHTMHTLVRALQRRDMEPCLKWIIDEKARVDAQIKQTEAELTREQGALEAASAAAATRVELIAS